MKFKDGIAFPDEDTFMIDEMKNQSYQQSHVDAVLRHVKDFRLAVDGGAHVGLWTRPFAAVFENVLAFEPCGDTMECLKENTKHLVNVIRFEAALHERAGDRVGMSNDSMNLARGNTGARFLAKGDAVVTVTIDNLELESLDLLKLDVEGAEPYALKGAEKTLRQCKPVIIFENKFHWKRYGFDRFAPQEFLRSLGARHLEKAGCDEIWGW